MKHIFIRIYAAILLIMLWGNASVLSLEPSGILSPKIIKEVKKDVDREESKERKADTIEEIKIEKELVPPEVMKKFGYPPGLKFFGYDFFERAPSTFAPIPNIPVPPTYNLGPGDVLKLVFWTNVGSETALVLKIDYNGQVQIPFVGLITCRGLTLHQFQEIVLGKLKSRFNNLQGYITLEEIKTLTVFIAGESRRPGAYTISGLSTSFNALYVAGGPSYLGSMRKIKIIRDNKEIRKIDLYNYLLSGESKDDVQLENGDTLFIPIVGPVIAISGKVKREGIYELLGGEKLTEAIFLSGGILATGYLKRVQVDRIEENKRRIVVDVDISNILNNPESPPNIQLQDGDIISIFEVLEPKFNVVEIQGQVNRPGIYELKKDMRVNDLIDTAEGTKIGVEIYYPRAEIYRKNEDNTTTIINFNLEKALLGDEKENLILQANDAVKIYTKDEMMWRDRKVTVDGAVQRPGIYERTENMTLKDLIFKAGGLLPEGWNIVTVSRQRGKDTILFESDVDKLLKQNDEGQNILLDDLDKISVKRLSEIKRTPDWMLIDGEVKMPGPYTLLKNETMYSLIKKCGGVTEDGFEEGAVFTRDINYITTLEQKKISEDIIKTMQSITERRYQAQLARYGVQQPQQPQVVVTGAGAPTEAQEKMTEVAPTQQALIGLTTVGEKLVGEEKGVSVIAPPREIPEVLATTRIPIDLKKIIATEGKNGNIILKPGDKIFIPKKPTTATVAGAVVNQGAILFEEGKKIEHYIEKVGGYSIDADKKNIVVVRASGKILPKNKVKYIELGDIIIVPTKALIIEDKTKWERIREAVKVLSDIGMAAYIIDSLGK